MKILTLIAFLLMSALAYSKPIKVVMMCRLSGDDVARVIVDGANYEGHIAFNRSMGFMACPFDVNERIANKRPYKCAGLWDDDIPAGTDTVVDVDFKFTEVGWKGIFTTNNQYGKRPVTVQCF